MILAKIPLEQHKNYEALSRAVANHIINRMLWKPDLKLGLATGFSPKLVYQYVGEQLIAPNDLQKSIRIIQLDEWLGIGPTDPDSCNHFIVEQVMNPWGLDRDNCFLLDGQPDKAEKEVGRLKKYLEKDPIDLCILGLGRNGHLALNEPGSTASDGCRIVHLHPISSKHSMIDNRKEMVLQGITIGLAEIMQSKEIFLIITGNEKTLAYSKLIEHKPVKEFPASILMEHKNWTCFLDQSSVN